jgi:hypothetical protein
VIVSCQQPSGLVSKPYKVLLACNFGNDLPYFLTVCDVYRVGDLCTISAKGIVPSSGNHFILDHLVSTFRVIDWDCVVLSDNVCQEGDLMVAKARTQVFMDVFHGLRPVLCIDSWGVIRGFVG